MIHLGIDPGKKGGFAFLDQEDNLDMYTTPMISNKSYDVQGIKNLLLSKNESLFIIIEKQSMRPGQGVKSTFETGKGFGILLGLVAGLEIPHKIVSPRKWQAKLYSSMSKKKDPKEKSKISAQRLFPSADFTKSERAYKPYDGLTDAANIAYWGKHIYKGETKKKAKSIK